MTVREAEARVTSRTTNIHTQWEVKSYVVMHGDQKLNDFHAGSIICIALQGSIEKWDNLFRLLLGPLVSIQPDAVLYYRRWPKDLALGCCHL